MAETTNKSLTLKDLPEYIDQRSEELITKSVFAPMSTTLFKVQSGVKAPTALNLLDTVISFGDGKTCGWSNEVQQTISQRTIVPGFIKVQGEYCQKDFYNTFASHLTNVAAGRETLPFEEYFVTDVIRNIGRNLEVAIWQGDVNAYDENLNKFDGLLKIMFADVPAANKQTVGSGDTMLDRVWNVYNAIPEETLFDTVIYMNNANFRTLIKELAYAHEGVGMYQYKPEVDGSLDIILPGTNTHVKAVSGLIGQDVIVACNPNHIVYGVDLENDMERFSFWFSTDNDTFRLRVEFSAGVQIALPNEVILNGTYVAPSSDSE